jgi:hypothetical protein
MLGHVEAKFGYLAGKPQDSRAKIASTQLKLNRYCNVLLCSHILRKNGFL